MCRVQDGPVVTLERCHRRVPAVCIAAPRIVAARGCADRTRHVSAEAARRDDHATATGRVNEGR